MQNATFQQHFAVCLMHSNLLNHSSENFLLTQDKHKTEHTHLWKFICQTANRVWMQLMRMACWHCWLLAWTLTRMSLSVCVPASICFCFPLSDMPSNEMCIIWNSVASPCLLLYVFHFLLNFTSKFSVFFPHSSFIFTINK